MIQEDKRTRGQDDQDFSLSFEESAVTSNAAWLVPG